MQRPFSRKFEKQRTLPVNRVASRAGASQFRATISSHRFTSSPIAPHSSSPSPPHHSPHLIRFSLFSCNRRSESSAQRQNRLDRDIRKAAARIAIEEPAQREARLGRQRRNASVRFGNETPAQTLCHKGRLARQREYDHARRNRTRRNWNANPEANSQGNPLHLVAFLDDQSKLRFGVPEEVYLGPMDVVCRNCGALHFRDEAQRQPGKSSFSEC